MKRKLYKAVESAGKELAERMTGCRDDLFLAADAYGQDTTIGATIRRAGDQLTVAITTFASTFDIESPSSCDSKLANAVLEAKFDAAEFFKAKALLARKGKRR